METRNGGGVAHMFATPVRGPSRPVRSQASLPREGGGVRHISATPVWKRLKTVRSTIQHPPPRNSFRRFLLAAQVELVRPVFALAQNESLTMRTSVRVVAAVVRAILAVDLTELKSAMQDLEAGGGIVT